MGSRLVGNQHSQVEGCTVRLCECGCGLPAPIAKMTAKRIGHIKGQPVRFRHGHWARTDAMRGDKNQNWKGGSFVHGSGYIMVQAPEHPRANSSGYVLEHIVIAERALGHYLPLRAEVHHVNETRADNRNKNLVICQDGAFHRLLHARKRAYQACGDPTARQCWLCRKWDPVCDRGKGKASYHKQCFLQYQQSKRSQRSKPCQNPFDSQRQR